MWIVERETGFLFETFDPNGLSWAIDQAVLFHNLPGDVKNREIARVMREGNGNL